MVTTSSTSRTASPATGARTRGRLARLARRCRAERPEKREIDGRKVACHYAEQIAAGDSIETLCDGVSSRRNQLLLDLGTELSLGAIDGAAEAAARQIAYAESQGFTAIALDPRALVAGDEAAVDAVAASAHATLAGGGSVIVHTAMGPESDLGDEIAEAPGARHAIGRGLGRLQAAPGQPGRGLVHPRESGGLLPVQTGAGDPQRGVRADAPHRRHVLGVVHGEQTGVVQHLGALPGDLG